LELASSAKGKAFSPSRQCDLFVQNLESLFNPGNDVVVLELPNGEAHGVLTFFSPADNGASIG